MQQLHRIACFTLELQDSTSSSVHFALITCYPQGATTSSSDVNCSTYSRRLQAFSTLLAGPQKIDNVLPNNASCTGNVRGIAVLGREMESCSWLLVADGLSCLPGLLYVIQVAVLSWSEVMTLKVLNTAAALTAQQYGVSIGRTHCVEYCKTVTVC